MAQQTINVGTAPNDGTGTPLRTAFQYTNSNFSELYTALGGGSGLPGTSGQVLFNNGTNIAGDAGLVYNSTTDALTIGGNVQAASATITGDLTVDTSTLKVDSANNRVIVGHTSGSSAFQVTNAGAAGIEIQPTGFSSAPLILSYNRSAPAYTQLTLDGSTIVHALSGSTAMTLNSTGLGVGVVPSAGKFEVQESGTGAGIGGIFASTASGGGNPGFVFRTASTNRWSLSLTGSAGAESIRFYDINNSATRLLIDSSGNVGIGVTPSAWGGLGTGPGVLQMGNAGCSVLAGGAGFSGTNQFFINNNAYYNAVGGGSFKYYRAGGGAAQYSQVGNEHQWKVSSNTPVADTAITFTQAMTLDASGNLLVGKTANYGTGETQTLQLKSSVIFGSDNTGSASNRNWSIGTNASAAGSMEWTISSTNTGWPNFAYRMQLTSAGAAYNTTGTWGTISDSRLKENISDARNYLADLLKLRVVKYSLKEEASAVATKLGLIAQEVEQVFPSLVEQSDVAYDGGDGIRTVKTSILVPMLLKAIQELTARVQTLETR